MKNIVIDASFILQALLSPSSNVAGISKKIFKAQKNRKAKIFSTSFMPLEIANGLRFSLGDKKLTEEIFSKFSLLKIEYFTFNHQQVRAVMLMSLNLGATVYDASYHFLAKMLGGEFYTCDKEYFQKAKKEENIALIK